MKPKVLFFDIETSPIMAHVWGLFDQNIALNQIHKDWHVLSWAAKWQGEKQVMYMDQRKARSVEDDRALMRSIWELLNEADVVVTQNGKRFDSKKLNARFLIHGFKPPRPYRHIDTLEIAKKYFAFTSNKLAYMSDKLCVKYKKLTHHKFEGFELWKECLAGNLSAWKEMERYNKHDVLALEELYDKLAPWDNSVNLHAYSNGLCKCGSNRLQKRGFAYSNAGRYQRYQCQSCGTWTKDAQNLLKQKVRRGIPQ